MTNSTTPAVPAVPRWGQAMVIFLRLELADAARSRWAVLAALVHVALIGSFLWLGLRESTVLGFTGLSRMLLNLASVVITVFPLLVLIATHSAVVRARSGGFCELMLAHPVARTSWFSAVLLARLILLVGPFLMIVAGALIAARVCGGDDDLLVMAARSLGISAALVFAFIGIGLLISASARTAERALVITLFVFVGTAALHDVLLIATLLRTSLPPEVVFALAALNPIEAARIGILTSVDPELSVLGPVGFWLANRLGAVWALLLAVLWPLAVGLVTTAVAAWQVRRGDLVV